MFLSELLPVFQKLVQQPIAFSGGFFSGLLKLDPNEDPLAEWLAKQGYSDNGKNANNDDDDNNRPQTISID